MAGGGESASLGSECGGVVTALCDDPAGVIVDEFITALRQGFDPASVCPPAGGGSVVVRFLAGDGALPLFEPSGKGCREPFLWVRAAHRYRSTPYRFPAAVLGGTVPCGDAAMVRVLAVEIGVGRCTSIGVDRSPQWDKIDREAEVSLDDSWRLETVQCAVGKRLKRLGHTSAHDTVAPAGPDGGLIAWTGLSYVQF